MTRGLLRHPRAVLLCAYAAVCLGVLGLTPLWLDEVLQLGVAWHRSWSELLPWIEVNPGAVPLPYFAEQLSLNIFGYTATAARTPAALFSIAAGGLFALLCDRLELRFRGLAMALLLLYPLQFRYALEARGYSQGVFFTVAVLWIFLILRESPSLPLAGLYFATIALGLYFHPFLVFPVGAQLLTTTRRDIWIAAVLAGLSFIPWVIVQHQARASYVFPALFPVGRVTPLTVLHELTGGGYASTIGLLILAGFGLLRAHRLLILTALFCIAGPLIADLAFHYFFAGRQFLMAAPALALLAAQGAELLWTRSRTAVVTCAAVFLGIAAVKDYQDATIPKDDLAASAHAVAARLTSANAADSCVVTKPAWELDYFSFFQPGVVFTPCADPPQASQVTFVAGPDNVLSPPPGGYTGAGVAQVGRSEVAVWSKTNVENGDKRDPR